MGSDTSRVSRDNVELVRNVLLAFSRKDLDAALESWGEDAEWRPAVLGGGLLEGSVYRGHEGVREFFRVQDETWDSITATPLAARDIGDRVMVEVQLNAKGRVSGAKVDRKTWNVFTIREGKIAAGRVFTSEVEASKAAGLSA
jgi:ketosteroid isomerase-like protein